jgi:hypothetical protein
MRLGRPATDVSGYATLVPRIEAETSQHQEKMATTQPSRKVFGDTRPCGLVIVTDDGEKLAVSIFMVVKCYLTLL